MAQTPSVGRIVHYHSYGTPGGEYLPEARAAIITAVADPRTAPRPLFTGGETHQSVSLAVLNPTGMHFNLDVPFSEEPRPGHWTWPPRT